MGLNQDNITQLGCQTKDEQTDVITEGAAWTIVSIDAVTYTFNDSFAPQKVAVSGEKEGCPIVHNVKQSGNHSELNAMIEIEGENFRSNQQVWFDDQPALTHYRCAEVLLCQVPHVSRLRNGWDVVKHSFSVRIIIIFFG